MQNKKKEDSKKDKIYERLLALEKENKQIKKKSKQIKTTMNNENKKLKKEVAIMKKNVKNFC
jgi:hypothetical protein